MLKNIYSFSKYFSTFSKYFTFNKYSENFEKYWVKVCKYDPTLSKLKHLANTP